MRKAANVRVDNDVHAGGNILYAGEYIVTMPSDYDPTLVTGEDILLDNAIRVESADLDA
jgi:hypothetical protein